MERLVFSANFVNFCTMSICNVTANMSKNSVFHKLHIKNDFNEYITKSM